MTADHELCHCGKPLHYSDPETERMVRRMTQVFGRFVKVTVAGRIWRVQRHYIALHGINGSTIQTLGFEEVTGDH